MTDEPKTTAPGWRDLLTIHVFLSESGLWAATADEPHGLLVTGRSLGEVLSRVPDELLNLRDAGAKMLRLERVDLA